MEDGSAQIATALSELLAGVRIGVLITEGGEGPWGSHAPFLPGDDWRTAWLHLSQLAQHTRNLVAQPRAGLYVCESDGPRKNPLSLPRVSFGGRAAPVPRGPAYDALKERYLQRFPQGAMMFGLGDFQLWELSMDTALYVGGFGRAYRAVRDAPSDWVHQRT